MVIFFSCVDAQVSCRDGSWCKINANWIIWVRGSDVARPEPTPMNPKETSLMTHPDASMKYDINNALFLNRMRPEVKKILKKN